MLPLQNQCFQLCVSASSSPVQGPSPTAPLCTGSQPKPPSPDIFKLFNLDLTVQGFPRYVHYVGYTVAMRSVGILLKCFLVLFSFSSATSIAMASITPSQSQVCEDCTEAYNKNKCLLTAIESGHHECLEDLLKAGADVNFGCQSVPPVDVTEHSQCKCDKMSIPTGTDPNRQYDQNYTPLMHAARHHQSEFAKILIQAGADVNRQNHNGDTALIEASCSNVSQCIEILTEAGADVNIQNCHGETALMIASCFNALRCIQILIQTGADVNIQDEWGTTALQVAIEHSHFESADCLLRAGADVNIQDFGGNSAVLIAVIKDNVKWTEKLIQLGADVNMSDTGGKRALVYAASLGHHKCLDLLIQAGAHMKITDSSGGTALHALAEYRVNDKCFETLIKAGIDVNLKNREW